MNTQINAYLNFDGKCREVLTFYHECLGGELSLQKIAESPMAAQMPSEAGSRILHGCLTKGNIVLMGSDMMGTGLMVGNNVTLLMSCSEDDDIQLYFNKLARGGSVKLPLHHSFWGSLYGELTDKYDMLWAFNQSK